MQCPKCHQPLNGVDYQGVHIETCPACGGDWLSAGELGSIIRARQMRFNEQECLAIAQAAKITGVKLNTVDRHLTCPECNSAMHATNYGDDSGIIIDQCPACHGVWLDRDELEKIQELVEGWHEELPADLNQFAPKMRQAAMDVDKDLYVHISHFRLINAMINGVFNFFGE